MAPLAFGTQTAGSVIRPAAYCGIVGFKPSFGRDPARRGQTARRQPRHDWHMARTVERRRVLRRRLSAAGPSLRDLAMPSAAAALRRFYRTADVGGGGAR